MYLCYNGTVYIPGCNRTVVGAGFAGTLDMEAAGKANAHSRTPAVVAYKSPINYLSMRKKWMLHLRMAVVLRRRLSIALLWWRITLRRVTLIGWRTAVALLASVVPLTGIVGHDVDELYVVTSKTRGGAMG